MCERILGISGSPRRGGNTRVLLEACLEAARQSGAETRLVDLAELSIAPCLACEPCQSTPERLCVQQDGMQEVYPAMLWAEAIVFATPTYMAGPSAQMKALIDRTRPLWRLNNALQTKLAAFITVGSGQWGGQELALRAMMDFALNHGMIIIGSATLGYGNWEVCGVADAPGAVRHDEAALAAARGLGRRLAQVRVSFDSR